MRLDMLKQIDTLRQQLAVFASQDPRMSLPSMMAIVEAAYIMARDGTNLAPQSEIVTELPIIDGSVSDLATVSVTWPLSGAVTVTTA